MSLQVQKRLLERDNSLQLSRASIKHLVRKVEGPSVRVTREAMLLLHMFLEQDANALMRKSSRLSKYDDIRHGAVPADGVVMRGVDVEEAAQL